MTTNMINPHELHAGYVRVNDPATCRHRYYAAFTKLGWHQVAKRVIRTATEAQKYADRLLARWRRLYDEATAQIADRAMEEEQA